MSDEANFLEGIQASPDDLFLRLVYADWLEERGDPRSEYLRVDGELLRLMSSLSPKASDVDRKLKQLRSRLKKLSKTLDAAWVAIFDGLRPLVFQCRVCRKLISATEAIDTHPRNYTKMKTTRYCRLCYEDAVRSQLNNWSQSYDDYDIRDRRGGRDDD